MSGVATVAVEKPTTSDKSVSVEKPASSIIIPVVPTLVTTGNVAITSSALAVTSGIAGPLVATAVAVGTASVIAFNRSRRPGARTLGVKRSAASTARRLAGGRGRGRGRIGRAASAARRIAGGVVGRVGRKSGSGRLASKGRLGSALANSRVGRAARRFAKGMSPVGRASGKALRKFGSGLSGGSKLTGKTASKLGRAIRGTIRKGEKSPVASKEKRKKHVPDKINEPTDKTAKPSKPKKSSAKPKNGKIKVAKGSGPKPGKNPGLGRSQLSEAMSQFMAMAASIQHRGNLETLMEAEDLPEIITTFGEALRMRTEEYQSGSIDPEFIQYYKTVCDAVDQVGVMSRQLSDLFAERHRALINNLTNSPRPEGWDSGNNGR